MDNFIKHYKTPSPQVLYRHFENEKYADEFMNGNDIRLGHYRSYSSPDDQTRSNPYEGKFQGHIEYNDRMTYTSLSGLYPIYCLCFFKPTADKTYREKYGKYVVAINDPNQLHERINKHLNKTPSSNFFGNMVYLEKIVNPINGQRDDRLLSLYSDKLINSEKQEFRLSYDIWLPDHNTNLKGISFSKNKEECYRKISNLPLYIHLHGIKINDLCEKIS